MATSSRYDGNRARMATRASVGELASRNELRNGPVIARLLLGEFRSARRPVPRDEALRLNRSKRIERGGQSFQVRFLVVEVVAGKDHAVCAVARERRVSAQSEDGQPRRQERFLESHYSQSGVVRPLFANCTCPYGTASDAFRRRHGNKAARSLLTHRQEVERARTKTL